MAKPIPLVEPLMSAVLPVRSMFMQGEPSERQLTEPISAPFPTNATSRTQT
jgi:hypothetical protein